MLSDSDINIDRTMASNSLKRKASSSVTKSHSSHVMASSSDAENRPITSSVTSSSSKKASKAEKQDAVPRKAAPSPSSHLGPASKKAKLSSATPLIELKNGKLVLKQRPVNWARMTEVMKATITFQEFLDRVDKLDEIPAEHLQAIAKLAHESDKSLGELAKSIRTQLIPEVELGSSDSEMSSASTGSKLKLPLSAIQAAISAIAERRNYGIHVSDISSDSTASTEGDALTVPASLQLWRWEVTDESMLPEDLLDNIVERRSDREAARTQAQQLFANLKQEERQALLDKSTKSKISATVAVDKTSTPSKAKAKAAAIAAGSSASQPIAIDDDLDDGSFADNENDRDGPSTPKAFHKRKTSSSMSTPQPTAKHSAASCEASTPSTSSSPKEKRKAKEPVELSPEKQKEKDEKEAAKAERLKAKEAKRLEREAKELEKQKAKEAKEAELKKVEEKKKRQASFFTSFVKKAAPRSPTKTSASTAVASSSGAAGKAATETVSDFDRTFLPCQYKDLAPINRFASPAGAAREPQMGQEDLTRDEMLSQLLTRCSAFKRSSASSALRRRKGVHPPVSVRDIKRIVTESDVLGGNAQEQAEKALDTLQDRSKVQLKLLQFESDRRPGWYGTWTKSTNLIGPRCPLAQDPVSLDYSYDSDADWEEMGQVEGEDVQDGEEKEEESVADEDEDSEMDDWLVDDLEVEEEEEQQRLAAMDVDDDIVEVDAKGLPVPPAPPAATTTNLLHPKKKKKVKLLGRRFDAKLVPFSTGPHWEGQFGKCDYDLFSTYRIEFLNDACFGLNPFTFTSAEPVDISAGDEAIPTSAMDAPTKVRKAALPAGGVLAALWGEANATPGSSDSTPPPTAPSTKEATGFKHQLREDAIPALLKTIDGSTKTRAGLVDDVKERLDKLGKPASKNAIAERITAYARKEKKPNSPWIVKDEWREKMGA